MLSLTLLFVRFNFFVSTFFGEKKCSYDLSYILYSKMVTFNHLNLTYMYCEQKRWKWEIFLIQNQPKSHTFIHNFVQTMQWLKRKITKYSWGRRLSKMISVLPKSFETVKLLETTRPLVSKEHFLKTWVGNKAWVRKFLNSGRIG